MKFIFSFHYFLFVTAIFLSFLFSSCAENAKTDADKSYAEIKNTGDSISKDFTEIKRVTEYLAGYTEALYEKGIALKNEAVIISDNGSMYKSDDGGSAIFVSKLIKYDDEVRNVINITSSLDSLFKDAIDSLSFLVKQVGYYDHHTIMRIFPYFDVSSHFAPDMDVRNYIFYSCADDEHNSAKKNVIVSEPYADPSGKGWVISSVSPVYSHRIFQGVIGLDISIEDMLSRYIDKNVADIMIVDSSGVCIAIDEDKTGLFNLPVRKKLKYLQANYYDDFSNEDYNLLQSKNKTVRTAFEKLLKENQDTWKLKLEEENYILYSHMIPELNWFVVKFEKVS
jgi:hypothetical protein